MIATREAFAKVFTATLGKLVCVALIGVSAVMVALSLARDPEFADWLWSAGAIYAVILGFGGAIMLSLSPGPNRPLSEAAVYWRGIAFAAGLTLVAWIARGPVYGLPFAACSGVGSLVAGAIWERHRPRLQTGAER